MKKLLLLAVVVLFTMNACKKTDSSSLIGVWKIDHALSKEYSNNQLIDTDDQPGGGATIEFKSDGKGVIRNPGAGDYNFTYSVSGSKLTIDGETGEIQNLKSNSVTLYGVDDPGPNRTETWTYLVK